jgi:hypothetical protein
MVKEPFIAAALFFAIFSAGACSKKQGTIAKTEIVLQDSLATGEISDDMLDAFEYEADSLENDESEN